MNVKFIEFLIIAEPYISFCCMKIHKCHATEIFNFYPSKGVLYKIDSSKQNVWKCIVAPVCGMKVYRWSKIIAYCFLSLPLEGGEFLTSRFGRFSPGKDT